jgi:hypothetical protein
MTFLSGFMMHAQEKTTAFILPAFFPESSHFYGYLYDLCRRRRVSKAYVLLFNWLSPPAAMRERGWQFSLDG